eukprot:CAMPEP_0185901772 /NCGR_PEP_ID=MMETSP0196C-20130402/1100_1 /TAXON_ID=2932 /ORGANISM="Alexandrium fundyense, Strain CCMP1719" /LENGTH=54 /DNA_ID=CAMNT_0028620485 /DNA_START=21 /DNA_END=185 /DNA_ORIENTATION=-
MRMSFALPWCSVFKAVLYPKLYFPLFMTSWRRALMESAAFDALDCFLIAIAAEG